MTKSALLACSLVPLLAASTLAQSTPRVISLPPPPKVAGTPTPATTSASETDDGRFDLKFPGGRVKEFVAAVAKAVGKPVNVVIPQESEDTLIPAMDVSRVNVRSLFRALSNASQREVTVPVMGGPPGVTSYQRVMVGYAFKSEDANPDTVWTFQAVTAPTIPAAEPPPAPVPQRVVQYYPVAEYLAAFSVEDITAAIEAGWALLDGSNAEAKINELRNDAKKELEDRMDAARKTLFEVVDLDEQIAKPDLSRDAKEKKMKERLEKVAKLQTQDREIRALQASGEKQLQEQSAQPRAGGGTAPTIRFHEETKLLICAGSPSQIALVPQVLNGLAQVTPKISKEEPAIVTRAKALKVEKIAFQSAPLASVVELIQRAALKQDPEGKGINILFSPEADATTAKVNLDATLWDISVMEMLKLVAENSGWKLEIRDQVFILEPRPTDTPPPLKSIPLPEPATSRPAGSSSTVPRPAAGPRPADTAKPSTPKP
jgi:hypothetical protein